MNAKWLTAMFVGVLAVVNVADACHTKGSKHSRGITGRINSVGKNSLSLTVPSSSGSTAMTVKVAANTKIMGASAQTLSSALVGHTATIVGTTERGGIRASEIVIN